MSTNLPEPKMEKATIADTAITAADNTVIMTADNTSTNSAEPEMPLGDVDLAACSMLAAVAAKYGTWHHKAEGTTAEGTMEGGGQI